MTEDELRQAEAKALQDFRQQRAEELKGKAFIRDAQKALKKRDEAIRKAKNLHKLNVPKDTDANGMLELTFGQDKRGLYETLSDADLKQFAQNINNAAENFKGGITPQQVIDWSLPADRERANKEIFLAFAIKRQGDTVKYVTNASKQSKDKQHYVSVQFLGYLPLLTGAKSMGAAAIKTAVTGGKVRVTCDCGRWQYHGYNYMAGLGNYQLGQKETRYPFIKNRQLVGLACKHILRVMHVITSPTGAQYWVNQAKKDREATNSNNSGDKPTAAQQAAEIQRQLDTAHHLRNQVTASQDKAGYADRQRKQAEKAQKKAEAFAKRQAAAQAKKSAGRQAAIARYDAMLKSKAITRAEYNLLMKGLK